MFLSDEQNTSRDIIDNCKGDDDDIDDQPKDKPSNGYGPPTGSSKKNKIVMLMKKKKKKKKKENLCFTERYRSDQSCHDTATAGNNINPTNPNKVLFFPFNKPYKLFFKKSTPSSPSPSNTAVASNACFPGKTSPSCFCFKRPPTLESSSTSTSTALQSQTSDPNHPNFTFDMLKSLIETNDFYSKECNPHSLDTTF